MKKWLVLAAVLAVAVFFVSTRTCFSTGLHYGLWLDHCPDGALRQSVTVRTEGLSRGGKAKVYIGVRAHYTQGPADTLSTSVCTRALAALPPLPCSTKTSG